MSDLIKLLALVPYPPDTTPSQRFRIEQWRPHLEQQGISVDLVPFANSQLMTLLHQRGHLAAKASEFRAAFIRRIAHVAAVRRYDVVLIHRAACLAGPAVLERAIKLFRRPVIFDFDDAIYMLHTTDANRRFGWLKFSGKTATLCRTSTHVVVGNSYLGDYARQYNSRVTVIPTSIDTDRFRTFDGKKTNGRVVVGWTGSSTSQTHLEMFAPVLRRLTERSNVELRVYSDREPDLPGVPYVWRRWSPEHEVEEIAHFDIGIMPTPDDQWARGKCSLKALQYMAMGIPAVCSAVGTNCEVIQHAQNGFLAMTPEEWLSHLQNLMDDPALRKRLGDAARRTVEERYSMTRCADLFAGVVRDVLDNRGVISDRLRRSQES